LTLYVNIGCNYESEVPKSDVGLFTDKSLL